MSYDFRDPSKAGADSTTLQIEVPHWAATVRVYNNLHQLVGNCSELEPRSESPPIYGAQATLAPGIYEVEATLEGRVERKVVALRANRPKKIKADEWKSLKSAAIAPRSSTVTSYEPHTFAAAEWSRKVTWQASQGTSRLFIFVRTTKPERHTSFARGLYLLDASGNTLTDFSDTTVKDVESGWMAFNALLPAGCYVLKRDRSDASLHCIPLYLCDGWETQVFVPARSAPSLRSLTLNFARNGAGYRPDDEEAFTAETVLESLRSGLKGKHLVDSGKLKTLLRGKFANPWLGILAAHVLLRSGAQDPLAETTVDADSELSNLFHEVLGNLSNFEGLSDHPDIRALQLRLNEPAVTPFPHPPLLRVGLERVWNHSLKWLKTIPYGSLTDCILDNALANSVWTAWRRFDRAPDDWNDTSTIAKAATRVNSSVQTRSGDSFAYSVVRTQITKAPVYRFIKDAGIVADETKEKRPIEAQQDPVNPVFRGALIQTVTNLLNKMGSSELPEVIDFDVSRAFENLISSIDPKVVSQTLNLPLSRVEYGIKFLRDIAAKAKSSEADLSLEAELNPTAKELFDYALTSVVAPAMVTSSSSKAAEPQMNEGVVSDTPPVSAGSDTVPQTIEESVNKLLAEAAGLAAKTKQENLSGEHRELSLKLSQRLQAVANGLLKYAEFIVVTDAASQILYANAAFTKFVAQPYGLTTPSLTGRENAQEGTAKQRKECEKAWINLLAAAPLGSSSIRSPLPGILIENWNLRRTKIKDESVHEKTVFLNVLRGKDIPSASYTINQEVSQLLPALSLYAVSFGVDDQERNTTNASRLEQVVMQLEQIVKQPNGEKTMSDDTGAQPSAVSNNVDEAELTKPTGTLYEQEFWGIQRHELIAAVADELIGDTARNEVRRILEPLDLVELSQIAGWADTVKRRRARPDDDEFTRAFLEDERNWTNDTWHYVNMPLDADEYSRTTYPAFTRTDDVVQTINVCIRVLKGTSDRFDEVNALRLLTHLVGDVHQPVHCGCCYIDKSSEPARLVRDPQEIVQENLESDQGGNNIILPIGTNGVSIHSYWDSRLGGSNPDIHDEGEGDAPADPVSPELKEMFVTKLHNMIVQDPVLSAPPEGEADASPVEEWAATWATDSLITARAAYETLEITQQNEQNERKYDVSWTSRQDYDSRCKPLVIERMKLAAHNLARMLDEIWS